MLTGDGTYSAPMSSRTHVDTQGAGFSDMVLGRLVLLSVTSLIVLSGCITPLNTRMPSFLPRHPRVEKHAYEFHDPFPDTLTGPETNQRPWGFGIQRTEPRHAADLKALRASQPGRVEPSRQPESLGSRYPNVVRP